MIGGLPIIYIIFLFLFGGFYESVSCLFCVGVIIWLLYRTKKNTELRIKINIVSISMLSLVLFYLLSIMWAVDSGMAVFGVFKYLPVVLFLIALMQDADAKEKLKKILPYVAAIMVIVSMAGKMIPAMESFFTVAGRLGGFFQYPNTFALFLLVSELLVLAKEKINKTDIVIALILIVGIVFTGSRTVFVLLVLSNFVIVMFSKSRTVKVVLLVTFLLVVLGLISGTELFDRFLAYSLSESTFVGRLLYFQDALPLIAKHPLGLGYMGYYYIQQSVQTGVYSVMFIHNDFLQIILDIGWLPFLLFAAAITKSLFSKNITKNDKLIVIVMVLHSCFDFNFQFAAIFSLFVLFLDFESGREVRLGKCKVAVKSVLIVLLFLCCYTAVVSGMAQLEKCETVHKIYPWHTQNEITRLMQTEDIQKADVIADAILERNEYVSIAYSAKARYAYAQGDFTNLIKYKNELFEKAPFQYDDYEEYCYMLINGIQLYAQSGDEASVTVCVKELQKTQERLEHLNDRLSERGRRIKDQPVTELPEEIQDYIRRLEVIN